MKNNKKTAAKRRARSLRDGEFDPHKMAVTTAPPTNSVSKYNIMYANLKKTPQKWYIVGWASNKRVAATRCSTLRKSWQHTIVAWEESCDERGGYDIKAVYYRSKIDYDTAYCKFSG